MFFYTSTSSTLHGHKFMRKVVTFLELLEIEKRFSLLSCVLKLMRIYYSLPVVVLSAGEGGGEGGDEQQLATSDVGDD